MSAPTREAGARRRPLLSKRPPATAVTVRYPYPGMIGYGYPLGVKIFLSWSGTRSRHVAEALTTWLKKVIQSADPWASVDMERGVKWLAEISKTLDERTIGIFCVTPGNQHSPWLMFEAGAMSRHLGDDGRVIPYLLDFRSSGDLEAPLGQFNACLADQGGTWQLIKTLNAHAEHRITEEAMLREVFEMWWPQLSTRLDEIRAESKSHPNPRRSDAEKLDEILGIVRSIDRREPVNNDKSVERRIQDARRQAAGGTIRDAVAAAATAFGLSVVKAEYHDNAVQLVLDPFSSEPSDEQLQVLSAISALHRISNGPVHWRFASGVLDDDKT